MKALTYVSIDKQISRGNTAAEVVADMRDQSFDARELAPDAFMRRAAATVYQWCKRPIRSDDPAEFLADLVDAGLLTQENSVRQPDDQQV